MIKIYSSSRGKGIKEILSNRYNVKTSFTVIGGGSYQSLLDQAIADISSTPKKGVCFFMGGIPDITQKLHDYHYEEVVYPNHPDETATQIDYTLSRLSVTVKEYGWSPVFCTILPMSITDWNHTRLYQRKTTHLSHFNYYGDMQYLLNKAITICNSTISAINNSNHVHTPYVHNTIVNCDHKKYTYRFNKLEDGVHPDNNTKQQIAQILYDSIIANTTQ